MSEAEHTAQSLTPISLKGSADAVAIAWNDGANHTIRWRILRDACPCATCRDERSQPPAPQELLPVLSPSEAAPLRVEAMHAIGNYAYGIHFSDGHNSGIYTFELLRALGEASEKHETDSPGDSGR